MSQQKRLVLVSQRPHLLDLALLPFKEAGFTLEVMGDLACAVNSLSVENPPALVILDLECEPTQLRQAAEKVLSHCALTSLTAVISLSPEAFHECTEGLGMLPPLPEVPDRSAGEALLAQVQRFLPKTDQAM